MMKELRSEEMLRIILITNIFFFTIHTLYLINYSYEGLINTKVSMIP